MKREKKKPGCFMNVLRVVLVLIVIFIGIGIAANNDSSKKPAATSAPTQAPVDLTTLSFTDAVKQAATANARSFRLEDVSCFDATDLHTATIIIDLGNVLAPKYEVQQCCEFLLKVSEAVFTSHPEADSIIFDYLTHAGGTDAKTTVHCILCTVTRDVHNKIDYAYWSKHLYTSTKDLWTMVNATIHPDLMKGVN